VLAAPVPVVFVTFSFCNVVSPFDVIAGRDVFAAVIVGVVPVPTSMIVFPRGITIFSAHVPDTLMVATVPAATASMVAWSFFVDEQVMLVVLVVRAREGPDESNIATDANKAGANKFCIVSSSSPCVNSKRLLCQTEHQSKPTIWSSIFSYLLGVNTDILHDLTGKTQNRPQHKEQLRPIPKAYQAREGQRQGDITSICCSRVGQRRLLPSESPKRWSDCGQPPQ